MRVAELAQAGVEPARPDDIMSLRWEQPGAADRRPGMYIGGRNESVNGFVQFADPGTGRSPVVSRSGTTALGAGQDCSRHFGIAVATADGQVHAIGGSDAEFTRQPTSKALTYCLAFELCGREQEISCASASSRAATSSIAIELNSATDPMTRRSTPALSRSQVYRSDPRALSDQTELACGSLIG